MLLKNAIELIEKIKKIPGDKIITIVSDDSLPSQFDILENGEIGYDPSHQELFRAKLIHAFNNSGGMIIRQFTKIYDQGLPVKKIYGVFLGNGGYIGLCKEEVEKACCTDAKTGKRIPREKNVVFCDFQ